MQAGIKVLTQLLTSQEEHGTLERTPIVRVVRREEGPVHLGPSSWGRGAGACESGGTMRMFCKYWGNCKLDPVLQQEQNSTEMGILLGDALRKADSSPQAANRKEKVAPHPQLMAAYVTPRSLSPCHPAPTS